MDLAWESNYIPSLEYCLRAQVTNVSLTILQGLQLWIFRVFTLDLVKGAALKIVASTNRPCWKQNQIKNARRSECSHCQKLGHKKHQFYELVGYPVNWHNQRSNQISQGRGRGIMKLWGGSGGSRERGNSVHQTNSGGSHMTQNCEFIEGDLFSCWLGRTGQGKCF